MQEEPKVHIELSPNEALALAGLIDEALRAYNAYGELAVSEPPSPGSGPFHAAFNAIREEGIKRAKALRDRLRSVASPN